MESLRTPSDLETLRGHRGLLYFSGIVELILGVVAILFAAATTVAFMALLGWILVLVGIVEFFQAFSVRGWSGTFLGIARGVLLAVLGFILAFNPAQSAAVLTLIVGSFLIAEGVVRLIAGVTMPFRRSGWLVLGGVVSGLLGVLILAQWPISGLWMIGLWVGLSLIANALWWLRLAMDLGRLPAETRQAA